MGAKNTKGKFGLEKEVLDLVKQTKFTEEQVLKYFWQTRYLTLNFWSTSLPNFCCLQRWWRCRRLFAVNVTTFQMRWASDTFWSHTSNLHSYFHTIELKLKLTGSLLAVEWIIIIKTINMMTRKLSMLCVTTWTDSVTGWGGWTEFLRSSSKCVSSHLNIYEAIVKDGLMECNHFLKIPEILHVVKKIPPKQLWYKI